MRAGQTRLSRAAMPWRAPPGRRREEAARRARAALRIAAVPLALAAFSRSLSAQAPVTIRGVLEFAYLLENLESEFYKAVLGDSATAAQNAAFAPVRSQLGSDPKLLAALEQIAK